MYMWMSSANKGITEVPPVGFWDGEGDGSVGLGLVLSSCPPGRLGVLVVALLPCLFHLLAAWLLLLLLPGPLASFVFWLLPFWFPFLLLWLWMLGLLGYAIWMVVVWLVVIAGSSWLASLSLVAVKNGNGGRLGLCG